MIVLYINGNGFCSNDISLFSSSATSLLINKGDTEYLPKKHCMQVAIFHLMIPSILYSNTCISLLYALSENETFCIKIAQCGKVEMSSARGGMLFHISDDDDDKNRKKKRMEREELEGRCMSTVGTDQSCIYLYMYKKQVLPVTCGFHYQDHNALVL